MRASPGYKHALCQAILLDPTSQHHHSIIPPPASPGPLAWPLRPPTVPASPGPLAPTAPAPVARTPTCPPSLPNPAVPTSNPSQCPEASSNATPWASRCICSALSTTRAETSFFTSPSSRARPLMAPSSSPPPRRPHPPSRPHPTSKQGATWSISGPSWVPASCLDSAMLEATGSGFSWTKRRAPSSATQSQLVWRNLTSWPRVSRKPSA